MVYPAPLRRRRRRRLLWLFVAAAVAVLIVVLVVQLRTERRRVSDYLEVANEAAQTYKGLAGDVELIVADLESIERPTLLATLADAVEQATAADEALRAAEAPTGAGPVSGYMAAASASWRDSLALLESTASSLLDDPQDPARRVLLDTVFLDMRVGDRSYGRFLAALEDLDDALLSFNFPEVRFVVPGMEVAYDGASVADRIATLADLGARHDLAVADISFLPAPVGDDQGVPVVPFSETFEAQVTIANRGNEPEATIEVLVILFQRDEAGTSLATETRTIESLEPGDAQTLSFTELPVVPGVLYELVARVELVEDADQSSDELRQVFLRSEAP